MSRAIYILILILALTACSSMPLDEAINRVQPGMDKAYVLDVVGNPRHTYRERGQDHWIYIYFQNERELSRTVIFDGGTVAKVTPARAKPNWEKEMEALGKSVDGKHE